MSEIIRGRPTIANSEVPPHIFEGLLHRSRVATWSDTATAVGTISNINRIVCMSLRMRYNAYFRLSLPFAILIRWLRLNNPFGGVVEWFKALVLKTRESR